MLRKMSTRTAHAKKIRKQYAKKVTTLHTSRVNFLPGRYVLELTSRTHSVHNSVALEELAIPVASSTSPSTWRVFPFPFAL